MADLIDRNEFMRLVQEAYQKAAEKAGTHFKDIVQVVRCKDCRFYLQSNEKCALLDTRLHFYETDKIWTGDCYCSWGERREDGKTD